MLSRVATDFVLNNHLQFSFEMAMHEGQRFTCLNNRYREDCFRTVQSITDSLTTVPSGKSRI
jgi:hypothetical protein